MRKLPLLAILVSLSSGCTIQEKAKEVVGDYVTSAALESAQRKLESAIAERGIDVAALKAHFLADKEGRISSESIMANTKEFAQSFLSLKLAEAQASIAEKLEAKLASYSGKNSQEVEAIRLKMDANADGAVSKDELKTAVEYKIVETKEGIKEDTKKLVISLVADVKDGTVSKEKFNEELDGYKNDLKGRFSDLWNYLIAGLATLVTGYGGKQVFSVKGKAKMDTRMSIIEKLLNIDLNGNSVIGNGGNKPAPAPTTTPPTTI